LKWAGLTGIGSSFLNKDFTKMIRYLKETSKPIVEVIDTYYHIDEDKAKEIVDLGVEVSFMSICGATKATYEKAMVGLNFERVIGNVRKLMQLKKEKKTHFPLLSFHYIVNKYNKPEMIPFLEMIKSFDSEVYEVFFTPLLHAFKEIEDMVVDISDEEVQAVKDKAKELGIHVGYNQAAVKCKPPITSCAKWVMPFVFATGHVIPCCIGNEANKRGFQKEHALGNVYEQSFKDIWYGEKYTKFRQMLREGKVPVQCSNCSIYDVSKH
jgi:radical SAM protein with 4Fe4S-binding SPASM domain